MLAAKSRLNETVLIVATPVSGFAPPVINRQRASSTLNWAWVASGRYQTVGAQPQAKTHKTSVAVTGPVFMWYRPVMRSARPPAAASPREFNRHRDGSFHPFFDKILAPAVNSLKPFWFRRRSVARARQDRARPDAGIPCTTRCTPAAAALPSVIGRPGSDFTNRRTSVAAMPLAQDQSVDVQRDLRASNPRKLGCILIHQSGSACLRWSYCSKGANQPGRSGARSCTTSRSSIVCAA